MDNSKNIHEKEIDLKEVIFSIWAYKLFVVVITTIAIFLSINYALNLKKEFTAEAIFSLNASDNSNPLGQFSDIAALVGASAGSGDNTTLQVVEETMARNFIKRLDKSVDFKSDTFFNTYNPHYVEAVWKAQVKKLIGYTSTVANENELIWGSIISSYEKHITLEITKAGNIKVSVNHSYAERASIIANAIVDQIIFETKQRKNKLQDDHLNYLSSKLSEALYDLNEKQSELKDFAKARTILPQEVFASASLRLEAIKKNIIDTNKIYSAAKKLKNLVVLNNLDESSYLKLRNSHPIVDQVSFRRIFGQTEIISGWAWPNLKTILDVLITLEERKARLDYDISIAQENVEQSSSDLEKYIKLYRDEKNAEATYTILIEQVKANSIISGYRPDERIILSSASVPIVPSSPKRNFIIMQGSILGLIVGSILAILYSSSKGVYFTNSKLLSVLPYNIKSSIKNSFWSHYRYSNKFNTIKNRKIHKKLRDLKIEINNSNKLFLIISSLGCSMKARSLSRILSENMQSPEFKIAHIDFSASKKNNKNLGNFKNTKFKVMEEFENVVFLCPKEHVNPMDFVGDRGASNYLRDLKSNFDLIILSTESNDVITLAKLFDKKETYHVCLTRKGKTRRRDLEHIANTLPFGAQFYG